MLENLLKEPPRESAPDAIAPPLPNPWEIPTPTPETHPIPDAWKLPIEPHPLIAAAKISEALRLPAPTAPAEPNPAQILLEDELKLKTGDRDKLASSIEEALALLSWAATVE